jgi:hypothetical protein
MSWDVLKIPIYQKWKDYWFKLHPRDIAEYSWNYIFTGGKEIRSKLFCELWNYLSPDTEVCAELAFAIECIHVTSIILDDTPWMDNATERRGRATLHTQFSPNKALLISYELMEIVRHIWKNNKPPHVSDEIWNSLLITKGQRLIIGQWYDIEKKGSLIELASLKTGVLFELVAETVALCTGFDTDFWRSWGNHIGILFQWMDDWMDMEQDKLQNNRNAFNENYEYTLHYYRFLWSKIVVGIGKGWFTRPFGIFIKKYFTDKFESLDIIPESTLQGDIQIVYPVNIKIPDYIIKEISNFGETSSINLLDNSKYNIPAKIKNEIIGENTINGLNEMTGINILKKLYTLSFNIFTYPSLKTNLWYVNENEWENHEEINYLIQYTKNIYNTK